MKEIITTAMTPPRTCTILINCYLLQTQSATTESAVSRRRSPSESRRKTYTDPERKTAENERTEKSISEKPRGKPSQDGPKPALPVRKLCLF